MKLGAKVKEKIARTIGEYFTTNEIANVFTDANIPTDKSLYAKWRITLDAFGKITTEECLFHILEEFCHPLNFLEPQIRKNFIEALNSILSYEDFTIQATERTAKLKSNAQIEKEKRGYENKLEYELEPTLDEINNMKVKFENDLLADKKKIETLRNNHQAYIDIIEIFCRDTKKPTKELNDAYLFLAKKLQETIKELGLRHHEIFIYKPFKDLYNAEIEWNGSGVASEMMLGPKLSWDAIRPSLHKLHSKIIGLYNAIEEDEQMTDDEKRLEEITTLISQKRAKDAPIGKGDVTKLEILHKYDKTNKNDFYITKKDDDFSYKGRHLNLSKKSDYYKVFCVLYAKLPQGGEVSYRDIIPEIKSILPKTQEDNKDKMRKFIQRNLTDRNNGFVRYAGIPETEDNGKPLIAIVRGSGIVFNNQTG